ncbi:Gx transporter family protein [Ruminococcaceae bacterium OttesenSCG-928-I18]|nr:Gx transporter family protein [Ruminococcaceae bacterium OttesenSCG-928-I18]
MKNSKARLVAFTGVLFALALVLGLFENVLAAALGLPPGVKPGLGNVVVMFCLFCVSKKQALLLVLLKAGFAFLVRGAVAGALSLAGGMLSLVVMCLLLLLPTPPSVLLLSVFGAICHNLGQILVVGLLFGQAVWVYLPILLVSGVAMGSLTALLLRVVLPPLRRIGLVDPCSVLSKAKRPPDDPPL